VSISKNGNDDEKECYQFFFDFFTVEQRGRFNYCMKREAGPRLDYMRVCTLHILISLHLFFLFNLQGALSADHGIIQQKTNRIFLKVAGSSNWSFARALEAIDTQYLGDNISFFFSKSSFLFYFHFEIIAFRYVCLLLTTHMMAYNSREASLGVCKRERELKKCALLCFE
jgi:hypothetical protein